MHAMSVCVGEKTHDICAHTEASESLCGNGMVDELEHCDDGNSESNDGCSSTCTVECGFDCGSAEPSSHGSDDRGTKRSWSERPRRRIAGGTAESGSLPRLPVCSR